jgi:hypothetical protein
VTDVDALSVTTALLFLATAALALFTRNLVAEAKTAWQQAQDARREMERARELSIRPELAIDVHPVGGIIGFLIIRNVGLGVALDVELRFVYEGVDDDPREWEERSVVPGESHQFPLPGAYRENVFAASTNPLTVRVTGRMHDLAGKPIEISAAVDVDGWARKAMQAEERIVGRRKIPGVEPE